VSVTLNPTELENPEELDTILKKKYEESLEAQRAANQPEDVSDIIAEQEKKRKRKAQKTDDKKKSKKYKEYKF